MANGCCCWSVSDRIRAFYLHSSLQGILAENLLRIFSRIPRTSLKIPKIPIGFPENPKMIQKNYKSRSFSGEENYPSFRCLITRLLQENRCLISMPGPSKKRQIHIWRQWPGVIENRRFEWERQRRKKLGWELAGNDSFDRLIDWSIDRLIDWSMDF